MVITGLDILLSERIDDFKSAKVGVVANQTSVTRQLIHISDALVASGIKIQAMFAPEHGVRGDVAAGVGIDDCTDERFGIPIHSLYRAFDRPACIDLSDIDVMLIDLQDVGARYYTHLSIVKSVMDKCAQAGVPIWILDRPNPISGLTPEGPQVEDGFASRVGLSGIPITHSLTLGEAARFISSISNTTYDLQIISMKNWSRSMCYDATGLQWVMPSPNIPSLDSAIVYPGTCLLEGTNVSEGRGTTRPFELVGAPWIDSMRLRDELQSYDLSGVLFREAYFSPTCCKFKGERCAGVQMHVVDRNNYRSVMTGIAVVSAIARLYPLEFSFNPPENNENYFFDLLAGNSWLRQAILDGKSPRHIAELWSDELAEYVKAAKEYYLYNK